jgi:hypothetical protein
MVCLSQNYLEKYIFSSATGCFSKPVKKWLTYKNAKLETQLEYRVQI